MMEYQEIQPEIIRQLDPFLRVFVVLFGAVIGSFLNVLIHRVPRKMSIVKPGSHCPACKTPIKFYDNIPILSYFILRGKCRKCKTAFSPRYMLIELITAALALALYSRFNVSIETLGYFVFVCLVIVIAFTDLETWLIPHAFTWPGIVLGVGFNFSLGLYNGLWSLAGAAGGVLLLLGFSLLWQIVKKEQALGGGDVWLFGMLLAWLRFETLPIILMLSAMQALIIGAPLAYLGVFQKIKPLDAEEDGFDPQKNHLPYGPFLSLAGIQTLFFGDYIIEWLYSFYDIQPPPLP